MHSLPTKALNLSALCLGIALCGNLGCFAPAADDSSDGDFGGEDSELNPIEPVDDDAPPPSGCPSDYDWEGTHYAFNLCDQGAIFRDNVQQLNPDGTFIWHSVYTDYTYAGDGGALDFVIALPSNSNAAATWKASADDGIYHYSIVLDSHPGFDVPGKNARMTVTRGPSWTPPPDATFDVLNHEEYLAIEDGTAIKFSSQRGKLVFSVNGVRRDTEVPAPVDSSAAFRFSVNVGNPAFWSSTAGIGVRGLAFTAGATPGPY